MHISLYQKHEGVDEEKHLQALPQPVHGKVIRTEETQQVTEIKIEK